MTSEKYVQWGYDLVKESYLKKSDELKKKDSLYQYHLLPFSKDFFSIKNSMLLFGGHEINLMPIGQEVLARDGLIPLSLFFKNVRAKDFHQILYIHKDFWFLVPEDWQRKVKFYELLSNTIHDLKNRPASIFITGMMNSSFADPDDFENEIQRLLKAIGSENINNMTVAAFLPSKGVELWGNWDDENILSISKKIFQEIKLNIETPSLNQILSTGSFKDTLYLEINKGLFIKDSFLEHYFLARGAGLLPKKVKDTDLYFRKIEELQCSLNHSYCFYELDYDAMVAIQDPMKTINFSYFKTAAEAASRKKVISYEWEKWYAAYIKRYYKKKLIL